MWARVVNAIAHGTRDLLLCKLKSVLRFPPWLWKTHKYQVHCRACPSLCRVRLCHWCAAGGRSSSLGSATVLPPMGASNGCLQSAHAVEAPLQPSFLLDVDADYSGMRHWPSLWPQATRHGSPAIGVATTRWRVLLPGHTMQQRGESAFSAPRVCSKRSWSGAGERARGRLHYALTAHARAATLWGSQEERQAWSKTLRSS